MPKRPMQDIVPGNSRSIRNVPIPEHRKVDIRGTSVSAVRRPAQSTVPVNDIAPARPEPTQENLRVVREEFEYHAEERVKKPRRFKRKLILGGSIAAVLILAFVLSSVLQAATITVTPRTATVTLNEGVTASKNAIAGALAYTPVTVETTGSQKVSASGEEQVDKPATGVIVIYNNYNSSAQRLIKNTRFETPEGLIYRITDSVTVPGKQGSTPGSVEATVTADATGDKYNVGLKDFTIPGFKGDPRFNSFYARSKTPLAGGFTGTIKVVADADKDRAESEIEAAAKTDLLKKMQAEKPANSVMFDTAYTFACTPLPQETVSDKEALIKMDCSLSAAVFDMQDLASFIARKYISGYQNDSLVINNPSELTFTPKGDFSPAASSDISFTLTGDATLEWTYDEAALKQALAGKRKADANAVFQSYPMIEKADISVRPSWKRSLPESVDDITITKSI